MKVRSPNLHDEGHLRAHYPLPDKLRVHDHEAMDGDAVWQHALGRGADSQAVREVCTSSPPVEESAGEVGLAEQPSTCAVLERKKGDYPW
jgi:hypothetical protein